MLLYPAYMKNKKIITISLIVIILIAVIIFTIAKNASKQEVAMGDPVDIVTDFYNPWLEAVKSETTDPYTEGYSKSPILSKELRKKIAEAQGAEEYLDPVVCQTVVPEKIATRTVHESETDVQILITARKSESTQQAIVDLKALNGGWYIEDINCSPGEFAPEREFSFDREGALIKDSIPAPFNPEHWHIVFEENGELGHVAPLFFDADSVCVDKKGNESECDTSTFFEAMNVSVKGQMSESGVQVKRFETK